MLGANGNEGSTRSPLLQKEALSVATIEFNFCSLYEALVSRLLTVSRPVKCTAFSHMHSKPDSVEGKQTEGWKWRRPN